jgi:hypothetical protein
MKPLRAHAYTVDHTYAAGRFRDAIVRAAWHWWDALRNEADVQTALRMAEDADDESLYEQLEHAKLTAQTYSAAAHFNTLELVRGIKTNETWCGEVAGRRVRVEWRPILWFLNVYVDND